MKTASQSNVTPRLKQDTPPRQAIKLKEMFKEKTVLLSREPGRIFFIKKGSVSMFFLKKGVDDCF
jgi:hypothetical protein